MVTSIPLSIDVLYTLLQRFQKKERWKIEMVTQLVQKK
jgi:hypothetical protein